MRRWLLDRPALVLAIVVLAFGSAMFASPLGITSGDAIRDNDWLNCRSFDVLSRMALLDGSWPLRTHLLGGGFPIAAHPSDGTWAPTILAVLLLGDVLGVKVNLLLLGFLGAWGTYRLGSWMGLGRPAALFGATLFAVSGWLPSMLLVGFYNQAFYLLAPGIAWCLLASPGRPDRLLLGGLGLALILQQGGHAFPAVVFFLGLLAWLQASREAARIWRGLLLLPLLTAPLAFARELGTALPLLAWLLPAAYLARERPLRRALLAGGGRLAAMVMTACALGAARLVGLATLSGQSAYRHRLQRGDALWFPDPGDSPWYSDERFYDSLAAFASGAIGRAPAMAEYGAIWGRLGDPLTPEYAWLGLTPIPALLALAGLTRARGKALPIAIATLLALGICFGWRMPPDLHFLLTWGVPPLDSLAQPVKYWNFFVLLGATLLAAVAVDRLATGRRAPAFAVLCALGLAHAFVQNRGPLRERFEHPLPTPPHEDWKQVALVAEDWWVPLGEARIRAMSDQLYLRELARPVLASEYVNLRRGVGTVDWYGSVVAAEEAAVPAEYRTLDDVVLPNPRYRGEVWTEAGSATVQVGHNRIAVAATLERPGRVIVNQAWLPGFATDVGTVVDEGGLLALELPAGASEATLTYRPRALRAGLGASALAALLWPALWWRLRRRPLPDDSGPDPASGPRDPAASATAA